MISPETYLNERIDDQIRWYDSKSQWNQRCFKRLRIIELVFASLIPLLVTLITTEAFALKVLVGLMGASIAAISGVIALYKFQENWTEYRTTAESLKHEKYLFLTGSAPYDSDVPFPLLVVRIEALISRENSVWAKTLKEKPRESPPSK